MDASCLYTLETCLGWASKVDQQVGPHLQKLSQLSDQIREQMKMYLDRLRSPYGPGPISSSVKAGLPSAMPNDPFLPCTTRSTPGRWPYP